MYEILCSIRPDFVLAVIRLDLEFRNDLQILDSSQLVTDPHPDVVQMFFLQGRSSTKVRSDHVEFDERFSLCDLPDQLDVFVCSDFPIFVRRNQAKMFVTQIVEQSRDNDLADVPVVFEGFHGAFKIFPPEGHTIFHVFYHLFAIASIRIGDDHAASVILLFRR